MSVRHLVLAVGAIALTFVTPGLARTSAEVASAIAPAAERRLEPHFVAAHVAYPPREVTLVALKAERRLEVWARDRDPSWRRVRDYTVWAASGTHGPKLREGDKQVPEGVYGISALNPNSRFHLSMKLDYPNAFDRAQAAREGRSHLGGDIFVHGGAASIGCIAIGDVAIEELYALVSRVGPSRVTVLVAPNDLRAQPPPDEPRAWVRALYTDLARRMAPFRR